MSQRRSRSRRAARAALRDIAVASCVAGVWSTLPALADVTAAAPQQGQQSIPERQSSPDSGQQGSVLDDWTSFRNRLSNQGIDLGLSYLSESASDVAGGKARGGTYAGQENLSLDLDWEKLASLRGFSTHLDFVSRQGSNLSTKNVGDVLFEAQEIYGSPAVEEAAVHLAYLYFEQELFDGNVDLKAGRLPVRNDFGALSGACFDFMSLSICANRASTADLSWTIFPLANWGGMAEFKLSEPLSFKIGGYEVNPNDGGKYGFNWGLGGASGVLIPAEFDWNEQLGEQRLPGVYKIGGSYDTSSLSEWYTATNGIPLPLTTAPPRQTQRGTFYLLGRQQISERDSSGRGVTVLAGYEYNTPEVSLFEHFAFVGLVDEGLVSWRPDDQAGFQVAYGRVSPLLTKVQQLQAQRGQPLSNDSPGVETNEVILEANYHVKFSPNLYIMPDLQYIVRPSAASTYPNAWVAGFRVEVSL